jgi:hypothetical protein
VKARTAAIWLIEGMLALVKRSTEKDMERKTASKTARGPREKICWWVKNALARRGTWLYTKHPKLCHQHDRWSQSDAMMRAFPVHLLRQWQRWGAITVAIKADSHSWTCPILAGTTAIRGSLVHVSKRRLSTSRLLRVLMHCAAAKHSRSEH